MRSAVRWETQALNGLLPLNWLDDFSSLSVEVEVRPAVGWGTQVLNGLLPLNWLDDFSSLSVDKWK